MNIDIKRVKIFVTIPLDSVGKVREAVCNAGAGIIGEYTFCTSSTKSIGTFIPSENANPHIGARNKLEFVEEETVSNYISDSEFNKEGLLQETKTIFGVTSLESLNSKNINEQEVIEELRKSHPYEEPAIDIIPLIDESEFK